MYLHDSCIGSLGGSHVSTGHTCEECAVEQLLQHSSEGYCQPYKYCTGSCEGSQWSSCYTQVSEGQGCRVFGCRFLARRLAGEQLLEAAHR